VIPFASTDLINVRQLGVGVVVAILLEILIVRPVLLPAAEAVLGRAGWWPTSSPSPTEDGRPGSVARRTHRAHLPGRRPRPAAQ
jgi:RND superfamily putative drug exporter